MPLPSSFSCVNCARRKVKCDKLSPCSSCSRVSVVCVYRAPPPSQRHRRRLTQGDLLSKIQELEGLLQDNGIAYNRLDSSWIQSPWEEKLVKGPSVDSGCSAEPAVPTGNRSMILGPKGSVKDALAIEQCNSAQLWSELSEDLKTPQISQLRQPIQEGEDESTIADSTLPAASLLISSPLSSAIGQLGLHPDPRRVVQLWQIFADHVNPLSKIIHAPTLQKRIFETAWNVESATKPLEATMFGVYALAVASMKPADCLRKFGESRSMLVSRYRSGAMRALAATDLLMTRDLGVLQALGLVLMIDQQSEISTTAVALAMRIAHKIGLHRAGQDARVPFFEQEVQVRLWWYIRGLDSRARRSMGLLATIDDLGNVRLPMNVNDADLHPNMTNLPAVQHTAATEMVYCLMKYDLWRFVRTSSHFSDGSNPREKAAQLTKLTTPEAMAKKKMVLGEVEHLLRHRYLDHLDTSIPLNHLSAAMANITIYTQRFTMLHPRNQPEGGKHMSQADQDLVFESSVRLLELDYAVRDTSYSALMIDHMTCRTQVEALVYMVSELRRRAGGDLVGTAWALLERMHEEQPEVMQGNDRFYTALADLTLMAWDTRWRSSSQASGAVPKFITTLQASRGNSGVLLETEAAQYDPSQTDFMGDMMHDETLEWTYWNDLLQL